MTLTDTPPAEPPTSPLFHREGYILKISGGAAELYAETRRGYVWGIATLAQLASLGGRGDLLIVDYPSFPYRGVVEGFYFEPWTWSDRRSIIRFQAYTKMNTYIYAPKDDPYHREKWRLQYPQEILSQLQGLAALSSLLEVDLVFAVSPGLSAVYSSKGDEDVLLEKYLSVAKLGVKSFGLFYDDIPEQLRHEEDKKRYTSLAEAHADFANRVYRRLTQELGSADLIVVPTEYRGVDMGPYFRELGRLLDTHIKLMWTGPLVCSTQITLEQASHVAQLSRGRLLVWDNYPVNDYARNRLNLGPLRGRDPRLPQALEGFLYNPMNEAWASRIPLATGADYAWNPQAYNPEESFNAALRLLEPGAEEAVATLTAMLGESTLWPRTPPAAQEAIQALANGSTGPAEKLLQRLTTLPDDILAADPKLYADTEPYLEKLRLLAEAGLQAITAANAEGPAKAWSHIAAGLQAWRRARGMRHIAGATSRHVEQVWYTFIETDFLGELLHALYAEAAKRLQLDAEVPWIFSNADHREGADWSRALDGDYTTWYTSRRSYTPEDAYFLIRFTKPRTLTVEASTQPPTATTHAELTLHADGKPLAGTAIQARELKAKPATLIRGPLAAQLHISPTLPRAYADRPSNTSVANLIDARLDTFYEAPPGRTTIYIDLGGPKKLTNITLLQSPTLPAKIQVYAAPGELPYPLLHLQAIDWKPLGRATSAYTRIPAPLETSYLKLEVEGPGHIHLLHTE